MISRTLVTRCCGLSSVIPRRMTFGTPITSGSRESILYLLLALSPIVHYSLFIIFCHPELFGEGSSWDFLPVFFLTIHFSLFIVFCHAEPQAWHPGFLSFFILHSSFFILHSSFFIPHSSFFIIFLHLQPYQLINLSPISPLLTVQLFNLLTIFSPPRTSKEVLDYRPRVPPITRPR